MKQRPLKRRIYSHHLSPGPIPSLRNGPPHKCSKNRYRGKAVVNNLHQQIKVIMKIGFASEAIRIASYTLQMDRILRHRIHRSNPEASGPHNGTYTTVSLSHAQPTGQFRAGANTQRRTQRHQRRHLDHATIVAPMQPNTK